jgi:uncharacterized protein (TIGR03067 family)
MLGGVHIISSFSRGLAMKIKLLVVLVACLLVAADDKKDEKKGSNKLQGTWNAVAQERDGQKTDSIKGDTLVVQGDKFTITTKRGEMKGTLKFDAKDENAVDFVMEGEGAPPGGAMMAIYKLDGDKLKICFAQPGSDARPKEMKADAGSNTMIIHLEKKKS